jgi:hypothetical protein
MWKAILSGGSYFRTNGVAPELILLGAGSGLTASDGRYIKNF